jgi:hypothetical protein
MLQTVANRAYCATGFSNSGDSLQSGFIRFLRSNKFALCHHSKCARRRGDRIAIQRPLIVNIVELGGG